MTLSTINQDGKTAFAVTITFVTLATIATGVRLLTRNVIKTRYEADDWLILAALIVSLVVGGLEIWGIIVGGGGQNVSAHITNYREIQGYLKAEFITAPFYFTCLTFVRLSITSLYRRLFAVPKFRQTAFVTDGFTAVYWIICVIVNIFACTPINFLWNPEENGSCLSGNFDKFTIASETFGIVLDVCILALPVRMIMTLQMATRNKIALCGIFLLGSFVIITNIVRLILIVHPNGYSVSFTQSDIWSIIHACTAIICASLPTYRPLFPRAAVLYHSLRARYTSLIHPHSSSTNTSAANRSEANATKLRYAEIPDGPIGRAYLTTIEGSVVSEEQSSKNSFPLQSIGVEKTVDVV